MDRTLNKHDMCSEGLTMRYVFTHEGRNYRTVAGPAIATDSMSPDYPREMMAAHTACRICWRDIAPGETVHELDTGHAAHERCLETAVFAIKEPDGTPAGTRVLYCRTCGGSDRPHTLMPTDYPHTREAYACNDCGRERTAKLFG